MKLVLKSYSQDVNILDPSDSAYYLTFVDEDLGNAELRLPVQQETIVALVEKTLAGSAERSADPADPEPESPSEDEEMGEEAGSADPEGATVFGDPGVEDPTVDLPELEDDLIDMVARPTAPDSEEEVSSL